MWIVIAFVSVGVNVEVEVEVVIERERRLRLASNVAVRVPVRRAGFVAIERTAADRPAI
jgi:hypothetical protein